MIFYGCPPPPISVVVIGWNGSEPLPGFGHVRSLGDYRETGLYSIQRLNERLLKAYEVRVILWNQHSAYYDHVNLTNDSIFANSSDMSASYPVDSVKYIEIFSESAITGKLWKSAVIGGTFSSLMLMGYLPPNPPEPDGKTFEVAAGIGFGIGLVFANRNSETVAVIRKQDLMNKSFSQLVDKFSAHGRQSCDKENQEATMHQGADEKHLEVLLPGDSVLEVGSGKSEQIHVPSEYPHGKRER